MAVVWRFAVLRGRKARLPRRVAHRFDGGDGVFSAIAYLMPEVSDFIIKNHGKYDKAFKCQADLIKLINVVNRFTFPFGYRVLSDALGCPLGVGREEVPPTMALSVERAKQEMKDIYRDIINKYLS